MQMNMGALQLVNMVKQGNPQQIVMGMLEQRAQQGNPVFKNLLNKVQQGAVSHRRRTPWQRSSRLLSCPQPQADRQLCFHKLP